MEYSHDPGLRTYLNEIGKYPLLTRQQEKDLARRVQANNDQEAKDKLVNSNLRFVVSIAKKYRHNGLEFKDLINEGNRGLIIAAERYDGRDNVKFASYASSWINQKILQALSNTSRNVRIPIDKVNLFMQMDKYSEQYELVHGSKPTDEDLIQRFLQDTPKPDRHDVLLTYYRFCNKEESLSVALNDEDDRTLQDMLEAEETISDLETEDLERTIRDVTSSRLNKREQKIIHLYYLAEPSFTLEQIGEEIGLTRERVRVIRNKALDKLGRSGPLKKLHKANYL
nr:RNA polymerase subunit sigma [Nanoarchaeum sp.]